MLYLIGLGLGDDADITVKGLEIARKCKTIYLETYTSLLPDSTKEKLEQQVGKEIKDADRKFVESVDSILEEAKSADVALLVVGDPLLATTHIDLLQRAKEKKVEVSVIHNASVFSGVAETGLQLYKFGKVTSVPFPQEKFKVTTFYDVVKQNQSINAHTLMLLDLHPQDDTFLSIKQASELLLTLATEKDDKELTAETMAVGCARLGSSNQQIVYASLEKLQTIDFGAAPYCLIIPGKMHFAEEEFLEQFIPRN